MGRVNPQDRGFHGDKCSHCGCSVPHRFCWDQAPQSWQRNRTVYTVAPQSSIEIFRKHGRMP